MVKLKLQPTPKSIAHWNLADDTGNNILRPRWNAIIDGKLPQYYLAELKKFKSYSNELISDTETYLQKTLPENYRSEVKARGNAIVGIGTTLEGAVAEGLIRNEKLVSKIENFINRSWNFSRGAGKGVHFTTPEEMVLINDMLDIAIDYLKSTYYLK